MAAPGRRRARAGWRSVGEPSDHWRDLLLRAAGGSLPGLLLDARFRYRDTQFDCEAGCMTLYWGAAGAFVLFLAMGLLGAKFLHLEGPQWYFFVGLLSALGLSAAALFYYFQTKMQERKEGSGGDGSAAPAAGGGDAASEPDQAIRAADARLAQSMAGVGVANLPALFVIGDRTTA